MLRMRTNQKQKDKMALWCKDLPELPESVREEESDGDNSSTDISQAFSKRYSPASFNSYSPDNDKGTDFTSVFREGIQISLIKMLQ